MHSHKKNAQTFTNMLIYIFTHLLLDTHIHHQKKLSFLRAQPTSHLSTHTYKWQHLIFTKSTGCEIGRCQRTESFSTHRAHGFLHCGPPIRPGAYALAYPAYPDTMPLVQAWISWRQSIVSRSVWKLRSSEIHQALSCQAQCERAFTQIEVLFLYRPINNEEH